ncbi:MAG TPA: DciA family protein [Geminicoccus sp.]|uniref:DUF721 domain-containing protein n=1 Tax=Geminicoccus sp. TaxID=2024832 RepID=UPI002E313A2F|nr:DciA family protein [Geminicoccus sp.]HEX2524966.1 DciA family protein [Geminicoccus sp.]
MAVRSTRNQTLSDMVDVVVGPAARKRGLAAATLIADWTLVVGERLSSRCQPIKLTFQPGRQSGGTLLLHAAASAALDLQFAERQVVERINAYYGFAAVARLKVVQAPPGRPVPRVRRAARSTPSSEQVEKLRADTEKVGDPQLAEALLRLGCSIAVLNGTRR